MIQTHTRTTGQSVRARVSCLIAAVMLSGLCCAPSYRFKSMLLYRDETVTGRAFSGRPIMLLPILTDRGFDNTPALSPTRQKEWLRVNRRDLAGVTHESFQQSYEEKHGIGTLGGFYTLLYAGDILAVQTSDSVWREMPPGYMMVMRMRNPARVRDFTGQLRRRVTLEGELWDTRTASTALRMTVAGICTDQEMADASFLWEGIIALFRMLPSSQPDWEQGDW